MLSSDQARKKVLVLSDNAELSRVIDLVVGQNLQVVTTVVGMRDKPIRAADLDAIDMMIVALSSYASEPVVALARTSLAGYIGHVPMLIISDKPFVSDPYARIVHMDFPFALNHLRTTVDKILNWQFPMDQRS